MYNNNQNLIKMFNNINSIDAIIIMIMGVIKLMAIIIKK